MPDYIALLEKKVLPALLKKNNLFFYGLSNFHERSLPIPADLSYTFPPNVQPCIALCLVLDGLVPLAINDRAILLRKGELMLEMPGTRSFTFFDPENLSFKQNKHMFIMFSRSNIRIHIGYLELPSRKIVVDEFIHLSVGEEIFDNMSLISTAAGWPETEAQYTFRGSLLTAVSLVLRYLRSEGAPRENTRNLQEILKDVQEYIDANYMLPLTLEGIAHVFGLSPSYLSCRYKERYNMGLHKALLICRLSRAECLLISGNKSVSEIASLCGFNSVQYFCQVFKEYYEVSPLSHRQEYQRKIVNILKK